MGKWQETIGHGFGTGRNVGESRKHDVIDERDGTLGGHHIEHWDGSQDAHVVLKPMQLGTSILRKKGDQ